MDPNPPLPDQPQGVTPLPRITEAELPRVIKRGFKVEPVKEEGSAAKERNKARALDELSHIEALRHNPSFQWFSDTCIERGFKKSRELLATADPEKPLTAIVATFQAQREVARFLDEHEKQHLLLVDPDNAAALDRVQARLDLH